MKNTKSIIILHFYLQTVFYLQTTVLIIVK